MPRTLQHNLTDRAIQAVAVLTVSGLAALAAWISYHHMLTLAQRNGHHGIDAHAFPLTVDGLDVIGMLVLLADRRNGRRSGPLPRIILGVGTLASITANIAVAPDNFIARAISGWTAIALLAAAKMLAHLFEPAAHTTSAAGSAPHPADKAAPTTAAEVAQANQSHRPPASATGRRASPHRNRADTARRLPTTEATLARWRAIWQATQHLDAATNEIAQQHGVSLRTLQFIRAAGQDGHLTAAPPTNDTPAPPNALRNRRIRRPDRTPTVCSPAPSPEQPHQPDRAAVAHHDDRRSASHPGESLMSSKALAGILTGLLLLVVLCVGGLGIGAGSIALAACADPRPNTSTGVPRPAVTTALTSPSGQTWTSEQIGNAAIIVAEGTRLRVPPRGWIIAVAVAMQESQLRNLGHLGAANDHDSLGLFQQRPSQGWGTPAQIQDPHYAATQFYQHLTDIPGWQDLPLTVAGQRVQLSAYPDAYAKWEDDAVAVVNAVGATTTGMAATEFTTWLGMCAALGADGQPSSSAEPLPDGFTFPPSTPPTIVTALTWALGQLRTPYAFGGDCTDAHSDNPAHQCDCSSLVQQAYHAAGINLPRTTSQQVHAGAAVHNTTQLLPGDLLFIPGSDGTATNPRHVGLYLGNGLLIHAPRTGDRVKVVKQSSWRGQLAQVRRVVMHRQ